MHVHGLVATLAVGCWAAQGAEPGALDGVLAEVLPIMEAELWGDIADEKEAGAFSGSCREARKLRAYDTYQLLAAGVTFRGRIAQLLQPVRACACAPLPPFNVWAAIIVPSLPRAYFPFFLLHASVQR
jgi:hypothetical protein